MKATKENVAKMIELKHGVKEALPYLPDNTGPIPCPSPIVKPLKKRTIFHVNDSLILYRFNTESDESDEDKLRKILRRLISLAKMMQ